MPSIGNVKHVSVQGHLCLWVASESYCLLMFSNAGNKRPGQPLGGEAPGDGSASKIRKETIPAPERPDSPSDLVIHPGSNPNIPWDRLLRPLSLIEAVNLESVSGRFREFVFVGQNRLVWNFNYRRCLVRNHGLVNPDTALIFLVDKIGKHCRQLIIKNTYHPPNDSDIFSKLEVLQSLYLKYSPHANGEPAFELDPWHGFLMNSATKLAKFREHQLTQLQATAKGTGEIRLDVHKSLRGVFPPRMGPFDTVYVNALNALLNYLISLERSLFSLQLARYEMYHKYFPPKATPEQRARYFQFDLKKLKPTNGNYALRKLRVIYNVEGVDFSAGKTAGTTPAKVKQYNDCFGITKESSVLEALETLYIKWEETDCLDVGLFGVKFRILCALEPLYYERNWSTSTRRKTLKNLSIDFSWKNARFKDVEADQPRFEAVWTCLGTSLAYAFEKDALQTLSLSLPSSPENGYIYFSESFIHQFVKERTMKYLRLVFKQAMPQVDLTFGVLNLQTLEISFPCLKKAGPQSNPDGAIEDAKRRSGKLFDLTHKFWKPSGQSGTTGEFVTSFKLKNAAYFDKKLATHLSVAFPNLIKFSFTAFHEQVYRQGDFLLGLTALLERCPDLAIIKLADSWPKYDLDFADLLDQLGRRSTKGHRQFAFFAKKAQITPGVQQVLNACLGSINCRLRIYIKQFSEKDEPSNLQVEGPPTPPSQGSGSSPLNSPRSQEQPTRYSPPPRSYFQGAYPLLRAGLAASNQNPRNRQIQTEQHYQASQLGHQRFESSQPPPRSTPRPQSQSRPQFLDSPQIPPSHAPRFQAARPTFPPTSDNFSERFYIWDLLPRPTSLRDPPRYQHLLEQIPRADGLYFVRRSNQSQQQPNFTNQLTGARNMPQGVLSQAGQQYDFRPNPSFQWQGSPANPSYFSFGTQNRPQDEAINLSISAHEPSRPNTPVLPQVDPNLNQPQPQPQQQGHQDEPKDP